MKLPKQEKAIAIGDSIARVLFLAWVRRGGIDLHEKVLYRSAARSADLQVKNDGKKIRKLARRSAKQAIIRMLQNT